MAARGIEKGDRVAVLDPNTHYQLEAAYGTMQLGAVHTPLNYRLVPDDFEYILSDAEVDAVYADYEYADKIEPIRDEVPTDIFVTNDTDPSTATGSRSTKSSMSREPTTTAQRWTRTTSSPSTTPRERRATRRASAGHTERRRFMPTLSLSPAHLRRRRVSVDAPDVPRQRVGSHLRRDGERRKARLYTRCGRRRHLRRRRTEDVSYRCGAPTVLHLADRYAAHDGEIETTGTNDVRFATAEPRPEARRTVEDDFALLPGTRLGATETGRLVTTSDARRFFEDGSNARFSVKKRQGIGYLGTDVRVVDEDGNDVPRDDETVGEIVVRGNQVMDRYWNKPEETEEAFSDRLEGYYHMGDLASVDEDGFAIQDRKKDIIISGGENISSIELEDTLFDHDAVGDVAVIPCPGDEWGESPKAFVVPNSGDPDNPGVTAEDLRTFTREQLATYKVVRRVEFVEELPTTATAEGPKYELREQECEDEDEMVGQG